MNKETSLLADYITKSGYYLEKIDNLKKKHLNSKDFFNSFGYLIMEILNEEKRFINLSRKNIDLPGLSNKYFGG